MSATHGFASKLYSSDPYEGVELLPFDPFGWKFEDQIFEHLIVELKPRAIIEVGSFKGASTRRMADLLKRHGIHRHDCPSMILAVDTWLGAWGHWDTTNSEPHEMMGWKNGRPTIFETFMSNVVHCGHEDVILPIAQTSSNGARILRHHGVKADLIYVDGSHEYLDVHADLNDYFVDLLRPGGVMFGDDWNLPEVQKAVRDFCTEELLDDLKIENGNHWVIRKAAS